MTKSRGIRRNMTRGELAEILTELRAGESCNQIATRRGRSTQTIAGIARAHGIAVRKGLGDQAQRQRSCRAAQEAALELRELKGELADHVDPWAARLRRIPATAAAAYLEGVRR